MSFDSAFHNDTHSSPSVKRHIFDLDENGDIIPAIIVPCDDNNDVRFISSDHGRAHDRSSMLGDADITSNLTTSNLSIFTQEALQEIGYTEADEPSSNKASHLEGGWGWVCVACSVFMNILTGGLVNTFSLISVELQTRYGISAQEAGWIYSLNMIAFMLSGPLCTALVKRYSCRSVAVASGFTLSLSILCLAYASNIILIYIGYSVVAGTSNAMQTMSTLLIIGEYFNKQRGKATGLSLSGKNMGQMIYAPLLSTLFHYYGYQGGLLITCGLTLHLCVGGALFWSPGKFQRSKTQNGTKSTLSKTDNLRTKNMENNTGDNKQVICDPQVKTELVQVVKYDIDYIGSEIHEDNRPTESGPTEGKQFKFITWYRSICRKPKSLVDISLLKDPLFLSYGVFLSIGMSTCASLYNACVAGIVQERGFTRQQMALLLSLSGGIGCLAKIAAGFIFDLKGLRPYRTHAFMVGCAIIATTMLCVPVVNGTTALYTTWLAYSIVTSFIGSQGSVVTVDMVGLKRHASALGLSMPFRGIGILMGPPLGGFLRDLTGSYDYSIYLSGTMLLCGAGLVEVMLILKRRTLAEIRKDTFGS